MNENGKISERTGVDYPTIELGGKTYAIKWTRAAAYDLSLAGVNLGGVVSAPGKLSIPFHQVVDGLYILIGFEGTKHELAELVHGKTQEAYDKMILSAGKIAPSKTAKLQESAADTQQPPVQ